APEKMSLIPSHAALRKGLRNSKVSRMMLDIVSKAIQIKVMMFWTASFTLSPCSSHHFLILSSICLMNLEICSYAGLIIPFQSHSAYSVTELITSSPCWSHHSLMVSNTHLTKARIPSKTVTMRFLTNS